MRLPCVALLLLFAFPENGLVLRLSEGGIVGDLAPQVEIHADGTVFVRGKRAPARMPKAELEALVRFVVDEKKFFAYDEKGVERALKRLQPGPMCGTGVVTTGVTVVTGKKRDSKRQVMLRTYADMYPKVAGLVELRDIADRLRLEAKLAEAGGRKRVEGWLKIANKRLAKRYPKERKLVIEEFIGLRQIPQEAGSADPIHGECAVFTRYEGTPQRIVSVTVRADGKAADAHVQQ